MSGCAGSIVGLGIAIVAAIGTIAFMYFEGVIIARRASRELKELVERFGFRPLEDSRPWFSEMGGYGGDVQGYRVEVAPDARNRKIFVTLRRELGCLIESKDPINRPAEGQVPFDFRNVYWQRFFKTRYATPLVAQWFQSLEGSSSAFETFIGRWNYELASHKYNTAHITIVDNELSCSPRRGGRTKPAGARQQLRLDDAARLIPDMVALAAFLDTYAPE